MDISKAITQVIETYKLDYLDSISLIGEKNIKINRVFINKTKAGEFMDSWEYLLREQGYKEPFTILVYYKTADMPVAMPYPTSYLNKSNVQEMPGAASNQTGSNPGSVRPTKRRFDFIK